MCSATARQRYDIRLRSFAEDRAWEGEAAGRRPTPAAGRVLSRSPTSSSLVSSRLSARRMSWRGVPISHEGRGRGGSTPGAWVSTFAAFRGLMAVGIAPMPGTRVQSIEIDWEKRSLADSRWQGVEDHPGRSARGTSDVDARRRFHPLQHEHARPGCCHLWVLRGGSKGTVCRIPCLHQTRADMRRCSPHVVEAYQWLTSPSGGGVDPGSIVGGGDSAGGHLAVGLVQRLMSSEAARGPAGVVLMSPWLDPGRERSRHGGRLEQCEGHKLLLSPRREAEFLEGCARPGV